MFQKPLIRLTAWNSGIFLLLFLLFGYTLYRYVAYEVIADVDMDLRRRSQIVQLGGVRPPIRTTVAGFLDPRLFVLFQDSEGKLISYYPLPFEDVAQVAAAAGAGSGQPKTKEWNHHMYRVMKEPFTGAQASSDNGGGLSPQIDFVITIALIDSEISTLRRLFNIIVAGLITSGAISTIAGYFLAKRALVPLRLAWEQQQRFVADASHELRTPVAVIQSSAELLLRHPDHTVEQEARQVSAVLREALRLGKLVDTLLTLARADANICMLAWERVGLSDLVDDVVEQFQPVMTAKQMALVVDRENDLELWADRERIRQLLVILLDNAVKYTAAAGNIWLVCRQNRDTVLISVADTGCGIRREDLPYVFDRFFRGDKGRSRSSGGTGLGLAIAQWIVRQHGGKIRIASEIGKGTELVVMLPITSQHL